MPKKTKKTAAKKKLTQRAKLAAAPKKFASGQKVKGATPYKVLDAPAIVLDRVARTFANLQQQRERSGTPMLDGFLKHTDPRGLISNIIHEPVGAVALITSKPNTVRANHYHKEDAHLCFVVSGRIEYYERVAGSRDEPEKFVITAGQGFYTGPQMEHAMYFPEETTFITLGRLSRTPEEYEHDLVRLFKPLVEPKVVADDGGHEVIAGTPSPAEAATATTPATPPVQEA